MLECVRLAVRSVLLTATLNAAIWTAATMAAQTAPASSAPASSPPGGIINGTIPGGPQTAPQDVPGLDARGSGGYRIVSPVVQPTLSPGVVELLELEGRFSDAVATGGGKAFAEWFADDAVVLNNGKPALLGRGAISAQAQWDPKLYRLSWVAQGAQMGPSNDMGFTWGHYEGRSADANGEPVITSGRYITVWKKTRAGWKVAMDASSNEPPAAGECCALAKP